MSDQPKKLIMSGVYGIRAAHYSVEVRESLHDGDDYSESHYDFDTREEVINFIKNDMGEDEYVFSVLYYAEGTTSNPKDVTHSIRKK